jgi:hypothetical protein
MPTQEKLYNITTAFIPHYVKTKVVATILLEVTQKL